MSVLSSSSCPLFSSCFIPSFTISFLFFCPFNHSFSSSSLSSSPHRRLSAPLCVFACLPGASQVCVLLIALFTPRCVDSGTTECFTNHNSRHSFNVFHLLGLMVHHSEEHQRNSIRQQSGSICTNFHWMRKSLSCPAAATHSASPLNTC